MNRKQNSGFSLVELLIYIAIFVVSGTMLVAILTSVTRVQVRQNSVNTVNRDIEFITGLIQRKVEESSAIDMEAGTPQGTLILRMPDGALDPTKISKVDERLFIEEGESEAHALTGPDVRVDLFKVTKYGNPGGRAIVHVNIGLSYNTESPREKFSRVIETAVTRISAANFDSDLVPTGANLNVGNEGNRWKDGYFSGKLKTDGNIAITNSSAGLVLKAPGGTCYKLAVNDSGGLVTAVEPCP
ncbi:MAG: type II secretion system protein [Candidatus Wolfebacteria bacterium]|nr:type II secretion system protein [Candidatus Wolfebacteria bacterium]MDP2704500.1 type II secretion system protein [bacterium]